MNIHHTVVSPVKISHLVLVGMIFLGASFAWFILGAVIQSRTIHVSERSGDSVSGRWGPPLRQTHPHARMRDSKGEGATLAPAQSQVSVKLVYQPVKMGLLWQRTYAVSFEGAYQFTNSTAVTQSMEIKMPLPAGNTLLDKINFTLGEGDKARRSMAAPVEGVISDTAQLAPGEKLSVHVSYECRGMDYWAYEFSDTSRIHDFSLTMNTNFQDVNFPVSSPLERKESGNGMEMRWRYDDAISAPGISMEMPRELNAGPVAAQISFYAPLSLLMFFGVLLVTSITKNVQLHPVNYFFLAAGFFAFPLLFSYMLDVFNVHFSFVVAATVSLVMVCGYLRLAAGEFIFRVGLVAQSAYMVLFSYSFFFKGLTGLTLTLGGVVSLGALMLLTARVNWSQKFSVSGGQVDSPPTPVPV